MAYNGILVLLSASSWRRQDRGGALPRPRFHFCCLALFAVVAMRRGIVRHVVVVLCEVLLVVRTRVGCAYTCVGCCIDVESRYT